MKKLIIIFVVALMAASCANFKKDTSALSDYVYTFFYNKKSSKMALANAIVRNPDSTEFYIKNSEFYDEKIYKAHFERYDNRTREILRKFNNKVFDFDKKSLISEDAKNHKGIIHSFYYLLDKKMYFTIEFIFIEGKWKLWLFSFDEIYKIETFK